MFVSGPYPSWFTVPSIPVHAGKESKPPPGEERLTPALALLLQIPTRTCRCWSAPSSWVWLLCGSSSPPSTRPAARCCTPDGSRSSRPWSSAGVCVCACLVFKRGNNYITSKQICTGTLGSPWSEQEAFLVAFKDEHTNYRGHHWESSVFLFPCPLLSLSVLLTRTHTEPHCWCAGGSLAPPISVCECVKALWVVRRLEKRNTSPG